MIRKQRFEPNAIEAVPLVAFEGEEHGVVIADHVFVDFLRISVVDNEIRHPDVTLKVSRCFGRGSRCQARMTSEQVGETNDIAKVVKMSGQSFRRVS